MHPALKMEVTALLYVHGLGDVANIYFYFYFFAANI